MLCLPLRTVISGVWMRRVFNPADQTTAAPRYAVVGESILAFAAPGMRRAAAFDVIQARQSQARGSCRW